MINSCENESQKKHNSFTNKSNGLVNNKLLIIFIIKLNNLIYNEHQRASDTVNISYKFFSDRADQGKQNLNVALSQNAAIMNYSPLL